MATTISHVQNDARADLLHRIAQGVSEDRLLRLSLVRSAVNGPARTLVRPILLRGVRHLSVVHRHATRDVTVNLPPDDAVQAIAGWVAEGVRSAHLQLNDSAYELVVSRKGRAMLRRVATTPPAKPAEPCETEDDGIDGEPLPAARAQTAAQTAARTAAQMAAPAAAQTTATAMPHDAARTRWVRVDRPYLHALGVTDAGHRVVPSMARKWRQINKFVELFDGALMRAGPTGTEIAPSEHAALQPVATGAPPRAPLRVIDFGAGKGYLTFALHDHLTTTLGRPVDVTGVELRADLAGDGNAIAERLGLQGLRFAQGDVRTETPRPVDAVIALHACDTATDHALYLGVSSGARIIMCSPCCHKELRPQLLAPHPLAPLLRHGVHLGQQADMVTDGLRALLLEACGYATQVFEFVALEHSQKNKMILAVRRPTPVGVDAAWRQIDDLKAFYGIRSQCFEALLRRASAADRPVTPPTAPPSTSPCR